MKPRTRNILLIAGAVVVVFLLWYFRSIVLYIIIAAVLSFMGRPLVRWLSKFRIGKFMISRGMAAFVTLFLMWVVFIGFFSFMIPLLVREFNILSTIDFDSVFQQLEEMFSRLINITKKQQPDYMSDRSLFEIVIESLGDKLNFKGIANILAQLVGIIGELAIAFFAVSFITFFFLKDENMFRNIILMLVPTNMEEKTSNIMNSISKLLRRYFIGILCEVTLVGLLVTIGLTIVGLGFQHAAVIGLLCGIFNIIPYLGPWIGAFLGLIIGAAVNINMNFMDYTLPLLTYMTIVFVIVQLIDNILFQPLIYSSSVKAHPLEIFIVILAAGSFMGVGGMIVAIPVYTIIRVIAREFFDNLKIVQQMTKNMGVQ
ncbi:MAG: AI-2E family transporter [Prolixibacteraceae bacterium]|nr:AI-2E family transporter [Prolixibacteraceae bacterium]